MSISQTDMHTNADHLLFSWFSPSYPVGSFAYSHGLEYAIHCGDVANRFQLYSWLHDVLVFGSGRNDAIFVSMAYRADCHEKLIQLSQLAMAYCASKERLDESIAQGTAFAKITSRTQDIELLDAPFPVVVGQAAQLCNLPLELTVSRYLHAWVANLISAGVRFIPLGQSDGQWALNELFPVIDRLTQQTIHADETHLGGISISADMASMHHETMQTRIFRT